VIRKLKAQTQVLTYAFAEQAPTVPLLYLETEAFMEFLSTLDRGQALLGIFKLHRTLPGHRLGFAALYAAFVSYEIGTQNEFDQGIAWLKQQGYITPTSEMQAGYTLTNFGFATP
jgi:hypothetical protein